MTIDNLSLFQGLGAKMGFLNQRQRVIAQNVSNADTPGYKPKDLVPVNFDKVLGNITKTGGIKPVSLDTTRAGHSGGANDVQDPKSRKQRETYEVAPAGNAVIMEEQLLMAGETVLDYNMTTNLIQKHVGMIQTALGVGR